MERASGRFAGNAQQDAHEFLGDLVNAIHDDLVRWGTLTHRASPSIDHSFSFEPPLTDSLIHWLTHRLIY